MQNTVLSAVSRKEHGKSAAKKIRREGKVPANFYFHGEKNQSLILDALEVNKMLASSHAILDLKIGKSRTNRKCIVREVQLDPLTGALLHLDLMGVKMTEKMAANVPVHLIGVAQEVRDQGGSVQQELHELHVECLPSDLPEVIEVDITGLKVGSHILVSDLEIPNVTILAEEDTAVAIAKIKGAASAEEETPAEEGGEAAEETESE